MQQAENDNRLVLKLNPGSSVFRGPDLTSEEFVIEETNSGVLFAVHSLKKQRSLNAGMVAGLLMNDNLDVFAPVPSTYDGAFYALTLLEKLTSVDTTQRHSTLGANELLELSGFIESVFWHAQVVGPKALLPYPEA